jgi:hypothetical protein
MLGRTRTGGRLLSLLSRMVSHSSITCCSFFRQLQGIVTMDSSKGQIRAAADLGLIFFRPCEP